MKKQPIFLALTATTIARCLIVTSCNDDDDTPSLPTDGLVAYYPFDGDASDKSGFANNGIVNGPQSVKNRKGADFSAYFFDGNDDFIEIPNSANINFSTNADFSISVWVKYNTVQGGSSNVNDILSKWVVDNQTPVEGYPFSLRMVNQRATTPVPGSLRWARYDGPGCVNNPVVSNDQVSFGDDSWHHCVFVKKSTLLYAYIDGLERSVAQDSTTCSTQNDAPLLIGLRDKLNKVSPFTGAVDDLRIYNRALSEAEIQQLYSE